MNTTLSVLFPANSRYHNIETTTLERPDGKNVTYLKRRFVPAPERFSLLQEHPVVQGDRLDNITAQYYNDPLLFWRICDANNAIKPAELTEEVGLRLRISLPEGIPGMPNVAE
jgi:hypothetical protein